MSDFYRYAGNSEFQDLNDVTRVVKLVPVATPDPHDPSTDEDWESTVATRDMVEIASWYESHTGFTALGLLEQDLVDAGPNLVQSSYDGQVFEGLILRGLRISHNNVTVRGCLLLDPVSTYGIYYNPTTGATITGTEIAYNTCRSTNGFERQFAYLNPAETVERSAWIHHNDIGNMFRSGIRVSNNVLTEYNYIHDLWVFEGSHNNCIRHQGSNGVSYRNLLTDGTSACMSFYFDHVPTVNTCRYEQNILGGAIEMPGGRVISSGAAPAYHIQMTGDGTQAVGVEIIGNYFYPGAAYGYATGAGVRFGEYGNAQSGNQVLATGEIINMPINGVATWQY